ncbi:cytochrome b2 [Cordyceps javanica]|nr:cytochrome b2 [Cordyceps javanica]
MSKKISVSEVRKHNNSDSCWIVVDEQVYDMTSFAPTHPGGAQIIYRYAGKDASDQYNAVHAPSLISKTLGSEQQVGKLDMVSAPADWNPDTPKGASSGSDKGKLPLSRVINLYDFETSARNSFSQQSWAYVNSASNDNITRDANIEMLKRIWFRPFVLRNVGHVNTSTSLFGCQLDMPVYISAVGTGRAAGPEGELAFARGAASSGIVHCISTPASYPHEEILEATPERAWFQLYVNKDRQKTEQLLQLIQKSGKVKALFVTVDLPIISKREDDERAGQGPVNGPGNKSGAGLARQTATFIDPELIWQDIPWIRKFTNLPIIIKGIQRWEDAQMAIRHGCDGIAVSNHGGRAADTSQPAIITLLELHKNLPEAFDKLVVLVDGGFRRGSDVVKAICLGASAVGFGRPFMYSVNYGAEGVAHAASLLREEIEIAMRLCGMTDLMADASPRYLNTKLVDGVVVVEREDGIDARPREWTMLVHWAMPILKRLVPEVILEDLSEALCNPHLQFSAQVETLPCYNGVTGDLLFSSPTPGARRVSRRRLRALLARGIEIRWSMSLKTITRTEGGVKAEFEDGTTVDADYLLGTDGTSSKVREILLGAGKSKPLGSGFLFATGINQYEDLDKTDAIVSKHPVAALMMGTSSVGGIGVLSAKESFDRSTWTTFWVKIWRGEPVDLRGQEALDYVRTQTAPLRDEFQLAIDWTPDDAYVSVNEMKYWVPIHWDNYDGRVTLAGDAAHPMLISAWRFRE